MKRINGNPSFIFSLVLAPLKSKCEPIIKISSKSALFLKDIVVDLNPSNFKLSLNPTLKNIENIHQIKHCQNISKVCLTLTRQKLKNVWGHLQKTNLQNLKLPSNSVQIQCLFWYSKREIKFNIWQYSLVFVQAYHYPCQIHEWEDSAKMVRLVTE